jgi:hypothetical protein
LVLLSKEIMLVSREGNEKQHCAVAKISLFNLYNDRWFWQAFLGKARQGIPEFRHPF